jgi:hypothetical protein
MFNVSLIWKWSSLRKFQHIQIYIWIDDKFEIFIGPDKMSEYFNKETLSDMKLIVKNSGHSFQLHKVILYSRAEFFRKLIQINPHEKVYEIDDDKLNLKLFTCLVFVLSFSNKMKFTLKHTKHNQQNVFWFIHSLFVCLF